MLRWLVGDQRELAQTGIGAMPDKILCAREFDVYQNLFTEKRRQDWLIGRWTAKRVVARLKGNLAPAPEYLGRLEIERLATGEPAVRNRPGRSVPVNSLSISHAGEKALVAGTTMKNVRLGVDIEQVVDRHRGLARDFFTSRERTYVERLPASLRSHGVNIIWSVKEAVLKVLGVGLSVSSLTVECIPPPLKEPCLYWQRCAVRIPAYPESAKRVYDIVAQWKIRTGFVLVIACGRTSN